MAENNVSARMLFPIYPGSKYVPFQSIIDDFYNSVYRCYRLEERGKYKENMDQSHMFYVSRHLIVNGSRTHGFGLTGALTTQLLGRRIKHSEMLCVCTQR